VTTTAVGVSRRRIIKRPRLTRMLDESGARLILLIAPAGYGKTTLARQWLEDKPAAWYRGGPASADVAALAVGLASAAAEIVPGAGDRMRQRLRASDRPEEDARVLGEMLAEDLAEWPDDTWLAIDDYHLASGEDAAQLLVAALVGACPMRVLLTSRWRPNWATARLRIYGEIFELSPSELAMNDEEALETLEAVGAHKAASPLLLQAGGWPAVIGLAALTRSLKIPDAQFSKSLTDYFAQELYEAADPGLRGSLYELSLAPTIDTRVARFLFGEDRAGVLLDQAVQLGVLTSVGVGVFELHPLLRHFLEVQSQQHGDETLVRKALDLGRFSIEAKRWDDAFSLTCRFGFTDLLNDLVSAASSEILAEGRLATLERWLSYAHDKRINSPALDLAEAQVAFRRGRHRDAETLALQAAHSSDLPTECISQAYSIAGHSAHLADREEEALHHYQDAERTAAESRQLRDALWGELLCALDLDRSDAKGALSRLESAGTETGDDRVRLATGKLFLALRQGTGIDLDHLGERTASQASDPIVRSSFLNAWVFALTFTADYSTALNASELQLREADRYRLTFALPSAYLNRARALRGLGDFRGAHSCLDKAESEDVPNDRGRLCLARALLLAAEDRDHAAIEVLLGPLPPFPTASLRDELLATRALIILKTEEIDESLRLIAQIETQRASVEAQIFVSCTKAVAAMRRGDGEALTLAGEAFAAAHRTGNLDSFVCAYRAHPELAAHVAEIPEARYELSALMARAEDQVLAHAVGLTLPTAASSGESTLSPRENEVYELIGQGMSNRDIAQTLFISEATVKVHVRRIFEKLGLRTRTQVALRAARRGRS